MHEDSEERSIIIFRIIGQFIDSSKPNKQHDQLKNIQLDDEVNIAFLQESIYVLILVLNEY